MTQPGFRIETAASVIARDLVTDYMARFALTIRRDRAASQAVVAVFIDALSGAMALTIAGKHGSREEVERLVAAKLRDALDRDLGHLGRHD